MSPSPPRKRGRPRLPPSQDANVDTRREYGREAARRRRARLLLGEGQPSVPVSLRPVGRPRLPPSDNMQTNKVREAQRLHAQKRKGELASLQREVVELKKERDQLRTNVDCFVTQLADVLAEADAHPDQVAVLHESLAALQAEHAQCSTALSAQREAALLDAALARTRATQLEDTNAALTTTREELSESQRNLKAAIQQRDNAAIWVHHLSGSVKGASQTRAKERSVLQAEFDALHVAHGHALATLQVDHAQCSAALSAHEESALLDAALARTRASQLEKAQAALTTTTRSLSESQGALSEALQQRGTEASRADSLASALQEAIQVQRKAADQRSELQEQLDALCAAHAGCAAALAVARATATSEHAKVAEARRRIQELEAAGHAAFDMTNAEVVSDQAQHLGQLFDRLANLAVRRPLAA